MVGQTGEALCVPPQTEVQADRPLSLSLTNRSSEGKVSERNNNAHLRTVDHQRVVTQGFKREQAQRLLAANGKRARYPRRERNASLEKGVGQSEFLFPE